MSVSCDICKYSASNAPEHYYCKKTLLFNNKLPITNKCADGKIDSFKYLTKYNKPYIEKEK